MAAVADRLYRSRDDRMLAGVAAGVAETLDADPSLVRIAWALLAVFTGGIAFVVYIVMAIVVPEAPAGYGGMPPAGSSGQPVWTPQPGPASGGGGAPATAPAAQPTASSWPSDREARRAARRARRSSGDPGRGALIAGVVLVAIGGVFLIREFVPWFDWHLWWPVGLIALGGLLLVLALIPGRSSD
jgi:phage shock protein C